MTLRLPLVEPHAREHEYCAYCPKLCRFACAVSTVEGRETTTPWAKMTSLHHVDHGNLPLEEAVAASWFGCTGCQRCKTFCDHDNEVANAMTAGRAEAVRARVAPASAYDIIEKHAARSQRASEAARDLFADAPDRGNVAFVPGCTACVLRPEDARAAYAGTAALVDGPVRVAADQCCGLPLLEAGDPDGFVSAAQRFLDRVATADEVVFQDPGCLHALLVHAPRLGVKHDVQMTHISQLAARHLDKLGSVSIEGAVRYHDPCKLGRGLGVYDEPRAVLSKILGVAPEELHQHRDQSECSGAGGQLPRTAPGSAAAIAKERHQAHEMVGGGTLVTGCPGSTHQLSGVDGSPVVSLSSLIARALEG